VAKPTPAKVSVECPHCGFKQTDYAAAKTTMCRQCGRYFSPGAPKAGLTLRTKEEAPANSGPGFASSLFQKFSNRNWSQPRSSVVECFECKRRHEVSEAATSTNCPSCSAHIDLRDYKITTSFSRSIRTRGDVHLTPKGDLSSTSVTCRSALIEGKLRGNLVCSETATIDYVGKLPGRLTGKQVIVERKSDVQCFRRVRAGSIEIRGRMIAEVIAETSVHIHKNASLEGNVTAKAITVEKGGIFSGQLIIGQADLRQAELLPKEKTGSAPAQREEKTDFPAAVTHPLRAT
jgi:cytoskeletal protein CcmA (bactofilin family)/ribosomal protein S27E